MLTVPAIATAILLLAGASAQLRPGVNLRLASRTTAVNPCVIGSAAQLKAIVTSGLDPYFP